MHYVPRTHARTHARTHYARTHARTHYARITHARWRAGFHTLVLCVQEIWFRRREMRMKQEMGVEVEQQRVRHCNRVRYLAGCCNRVG
jgi:hypothetical protein